MSEVAAGAESAPDVTLNAGPITRTQLALYCGGSGDHNPIHVDPEAAKAAGLPDVIAHGMLSAGFLGRMLTDAFGASSVLKLKIRFGGMTNVGDVVSCRGYTVRTGERERELRLEALVGDRVILSGIAVVANVNAGADGH
jgi:acyl dehydratase